MNPLYCGSHQTCSSCVASMDPYCVYDTIQEACVGINSANRDAALQNVTGGVADCPIGKDFDIAIPLAVCMHCEVVTYNVRMFTDLHDDACP